MESVEKEQRDSTVMESDGERDLSVMALGEEEINKKLANCDNYIGTFALDEILNIKIKQYPVNLVVNLDKRENGGLHWIALCMYADSIYICDPIGGLNPSENFPSELITFLHTMVYQKQLFITRQLQCLNSYTCGHYCILFVKLMCKNNNFELFQSLFSTDCKQNDKIIHNILQTFELLKHI